ncbi:MAG: biotin--[acetyl-CoA-carboxylase] ligase [Candidatus Pelagibacter sp.]
MKLKIFPFKKVKSTNSTAIRLINQNIKFGVVTSERQYKGRGQGTNRWISNYGNIFLSIFFPVKKKLPIKNITKINLNVVKKVIKKHINEKINIKLPNDILINQSKICGILQEIIFKNNIKYIIIGIGINLNNSPIIPNYCTSYLNKYSKKNIKKFELIKELKINFEKKIENFI